MRARGALLSRARRATTLVALLAAAALGGCATRERANPFDPANAHTGGRPAGFEALAREGRVELLWDTPASPGLVGYEVYRRTADESTFHSISAVLAPQVTSFTDRGLLDGLDHHYRLYYVFASGPGSDPSEDVATPGPQVPWVADGGGALLEITADGRHVAVRHTRVTTPTAVAADTTSHIVWCSDPDAGQVHVLDALTGVQVEIPVSGTPGALAIVPTDSSAWVCREDAGTVTHYAPTGAVLGTIANVGLPLGVAVSGYDGSIWVCDRSGGRVLHRDPDLGDLGPVAIPAPSRVAVDATTGEAWVTSYSNASVWKLSPAGAPLAALSGFAGPVGIAVDPVRGNVWVADPLADRVRVLAASDGHVRFDVAGISGARSVAVDAASGEAWVTAVLSSELVRIAPDGTILRRLGGFGSVNDVAVAR